MSVKNRNGLERYRLVNQSVDALPTNAKFYLDCQLRIFAKEYPESKNRKDRYLVLQALDLKKAEYNRVLNKDPDDTKLKEIVWNVMDTAST